MDYRSLKVIETVTSKKLGYIFCRAMLASSAALRPVYSHATQLDVELSSVELSCVGVAIDTSPTQLNSTRRRVELCCNKRAFSRHAVSVCLFVCLSVRPSVTFHILSKTNKHIFKFFSQTGIATSF